MIQELDDLKDRAWLTSKCHMMAEKRFRFYDITSHLIIVYYSLSILAFSAFYQPSENSSISLGLTNIVFSAIVVVASAIVYGFRFGEIAASHRAAYLRLDALHDSPCEVERFTKEYHSILETYPNHHDADYYSMLFDRIVIQKQQLRSGRNSICVNRLILWLQFLIKYIIRFILTTILFFSPLVPIWLYYLS